MYKQGTNTFSNSATLAWIASLHILCHVSSPILLLKKLLMRVLQMVHCIGMGIPTGFDAGQAMGMGCHI